MYIALFWVYGRRWFAWIKNQRINVNMKIKCMKKRKGSKNSQIKYKTKAITEKKSLAMAALDGWIDRWLLFVKDTADERRTHIVALVIGVIFSIFLHYITFFVFFLGCSILLLLAFYHKRWISRQNNNELISSYKI